MYTEDIIMLLITLVLLTVVAIALYAWVADMRMAEECIMRGGQWISDHGCGHFIPLGAQ